MKLECCRYNQGTFGWTKGVWEIGSDPWILELKIIQMRSDLPPTTELNTGMRLITTFRSTTHHTYDGCSVKIIINYSIII
jgi:hypothetical protein